jgi:hypothetical protein
VYGDVHPIESDSHLDLLLAREMPGVGRDIESSGWEEGVDGVCDLPDSIKQSSSTMVMEMR